MVRIANHREPPIVDLLLGRDVPALRRLLMLAYRPGFFAMIISSTLIQNTSSVYAKAARDCWGFWQRQNASSSGRNYEHSRHCLSMCLA